MQELYRMIQNLEPGKRHELYTALTGEHAGGKVLVTDGKVVWSSFPSGADGIRSLPSTEVLQEQFGHVKHLVVCGCGFVGQAVTRLAHFLEWDVTAIDDREEYAMQAGLAGAQETCCGEYSGILRELPSDEGTCFVIVTREHSFDRACLDEILEKPFGYLGVMGSHRRCGRLRESLRQEGRSEELIERIHAPIGLSIGAQSPEEIAVSIVAQIIDDSAKGPASSFIPGSLMDAILEACAPAAERRAAIAVIASQSGSTPRAAGTRMLIYEDGSTVGTLGGGIMEAKVIQKAQSLFQEQAPFQPCFWTVDLSGQSSEHPDAFCGGITQIFLELLGSAS